MIRILSPLCASGSVQMAVDEALLAVPGPTTVRLYAWTPPAVSLGFFQDYRSVVQRLPRDMPLVRRITGGGAIWHEHEWTFALVGRLGQDGLPSRLADLYPRLHHAVRMTLACHGATLSGQVASIGDRRYREEPRCFAAPAQGDLMAPTGGKVLGSAGRCRGGRVLVHGSLKLASNPWDGAAVAGCGLDGDTAALALTEGILSILEGPVIAGALSPAETAQRDRVLAERYGDEAWVRERRGPRA